MYKEKIRVAETNKYTHHSNQPRGEKGLCQNRKPLKKYMSHESKVVTEGLERSLST